MSTSHGHASFTAEGVDDARRGYPATDLSSYAHARGLEPVGQVLIGHVAGLNPLWTDYVFNVLRGELPGGRFGTLQHELHEVGLGDDGEPTQPGEYFGRRSAARPGLGSLVGIRRDPPNEPFAASSIWMPATGAKVLVPEAALLPRAVVLSTTHAVWTEPSLAPWAPGFRMRSSRWIDEPLRASVAAAIAGPLQSLDATFVRVELSHGALGIRIDGFRSDAESLDGLVAATVAMADSLAQVARPWWIERDLDEPLWAFDRSTHPGGYRSFESDMERSGLDALERDAQRWSMVVEDPVALHRVAPTLPLPGTSMGVLRGTLPDSNAVGRLTWQTQSHPASSSYLRRAAVVRARPDAPELPAGGVLIADTDMYVAHRDGVACCWTRTNSEGRLDTDDLAQRAVATFRLAGVAEV